MLGMEIVEMVHLKNTLKFGDKRITNLSENLMYGSMDVYLGKSVFIIVI